jgi:quercetin dioxygenase-like cupin family protein
LKNSQLTSGEMPRISGTDTSHGAGFMVDSAMDIASDSPMVINTTFPPQSIVVPPDGGKTISAYGDIAQIKLSGEQTKGSMVVALSTSPPSGGPPPHRHRNEDEMFLVVEGSIRFLANGEWTEPLEPGSIVYTPRGAVHTFQNVGETPCRQFVIATPSGFELFFSKSAAVFAAAGEGRMPDLARLLAISEEHQIEFVPPLTVPQ